MYFIVDSKMTLLSILLIESCHIDTVALGYLNDSVYSLGEDNPFIFLQSIDQRM